MSGFEVENFRKIEKIGEGIVLCVMRFELLQL